MSSRRLPPLTRTNARRSRSLLAALVRGSAHRRGQVRQHQGACHRHRQGPVADCAGNPLDKAFARDRPSRHCRRHTRWNLPCEAPRRPPRQMERAGGDAGGEGFIGIHI